jgi:chaperonin GroES
MISLRPLEDRIVVRPSEPEERSRGGILLPDTAKEKPTRGEVIAVGPGRLLKTGRRAAMSVKVGDQVLFARYGGTEVKLDGVEYRIIHENELLAVFGRL